MTEYIILAIICIVIFIVLRNPKNIEKIKKIIVEIVLDKFLLPEFKLDHNAIKKSSIQLLKDASTFSDKILLRSYSKPENCDIEDFGIFFLCTGRMGIGFELAMPPVATDSITDNIRDTVQRFDDIKDLVVEIKTISSKNVDWFCDNIEKVSKCNSKVGNAVILKKIKEDHIKKIKRWTDEESMSEKKGLRFFARDFRTFIFFLFPKGYSQEKIKDHFGTIKSAIPNLTGIEPHLLVVLYHEILKNNYTEALHDLHQPINKQIAKGIEVDISDRNGVIRIGKEKFARVLTTNRYPIHTTATDIQNAFFDFNGLKEYPITGSFMASLILHFENAKKLKSQILKKATKNVGSIGSFMESKEGGKQAATNPNLKNVFNESKDIIEYINDGEKIAEAFYSLIIFEPNQDRLRKTCESIKRSFKNISYGGWEIEEETTPITSFMTFIHSLPLNFDLTTKNFINRYNLFFSSNISAVMPILGTYKGDNKPVLKFFNRTGQVCGIDFFSGENNYNVNIIGQSGTGKSFLTNSIVLAYLQAGAKLTIFDIGKSYKPQCSLVGGEYIVFDDTKDICLNFFTYAIEEKISLETLKGTDYLSFLNTKVNISSVSKDGYIHTLSDDTLESCVKIIGAMLNTNFQIMTAGVQEEVSLAKNIITNALSLAFVRKGRDAGMIDVLNALITLKKDMNNDEIFDTIITGIAPYSNKDQIYYKYFNGANNINIHSDFTLVETEEIAGKAIYNVIYLAMLERVVQECYFDRSKQKIVIFDECAPLLRHEIVAPYLDDASRRLRKYNASMITVTQNPEDFEANPRAKTIWQNSDFKLLLPIKDVGQYFQNDRILSNLNDYQKKLLERTNSFLPIYSEVTCFAGKITEILRLKVTPMQYSIFTSKADEVNKRLEFQKKYSLSENQAILFYAYFLEGHFSESEILEKVKKETTKEDTTFWAGVLRKAITNKSIIPFAQPIYNTNQQIISYEFFLKIEATKQDTSELFGLNHFSDIAVEQKLLTNLHKQLFSKSIDIAKRNHLSAVSFNVDNSEINENYFSYMGGIFKSFNNGVVILEINSGFLRERNLEDIDSFVNASKEYNNVQIVISGVDLDLNLEMIQRIKPVSIKVDGELIKTAIKRKDKTDLEKLRLFVQIGNTYGIGIVAMHIETEETFIFAKEIGFDYFQGYYLAKPENAEELLQRNTK